MDFIIFLVNFLFSVVYLLLALRALLPWFPHNRSNPFLRPVYLATEPFLSVIRAGLPPLRMGVDFSPFVAIILLWIVQQVFLKLIA